ncbi:MAG: N-acetylglucosamine-6-phosphate deacetylase [Lachnospiraceae bacterium]|nr:N-acetylglucosamine-6-phosphate deacetylase [Lachnospiraceae bacterium]
MIIKNGSVFTEEGKFKQGNVIIADGMIKDIVCDAEVEDTEVIDATDCYVIPGLVDIHFHGCVGHDFCDGTHEAFDAITEYQLKNGVTSISPATMTLSREELAGIFKAAGTYENKTGSTIRGITMEGPFVSLAKKGAQNGAYIHKPDVEFYREMQDLSGNLIKQVAVAPEEDTDLAFTKEISKETTISVAHTTANYDIANAAFNNGATHVTHLFNAMPPFLHRDPAVVGAAFDHENVCVEMICDGIHLHPSTVRCMFKLFGADRICMISDSMMATGLTDGDYALGGQPVKVTGKTATLADGTIAGSASNLHDCLKVAVKEMGIPLEEAVLASTKTPAKSLCLDGECGILAVGRIADLVILDKELNICKVIKNGTIVE